MRRRFQICKHDCNDCYRKFTAASSACDRLCALYSVSTAIPEKQTFKERNDFMNKTDRKIDRRTFLQLTGATALTTLQGNIAKALAIPANNRTGTIKDVEHIVILMQENRPFDHHFGTLFGVR